ncbi:2-oxo acid dehydrogenase subunit E2 [Marinobacter halodurans]|uniref:Dihydrolipoamide acetyltransferase component of pyruvate dehydrogenase complex n=1 Tax=Marinobacter halodurans TaxID=2528979 RepID=A0ABY1ZFI8_9GAMM|nr:dihydrolipoamide acetyltransferase family protein [Marinobacter halodurans]TBW49384.1 2-oxo acid dehydrogenase subunit E2 [Marinobacter halodurans]
MTQEFKFSDPGEGLKEAEVLEVHVSEGDRVQDGDIVLTVETDKANTDVPAPFSGTVRKINASEGDMVEVGDVLLTYDEEGESGDTGEDSKEKVSVSRKDDDAPRSGTDESGRDSDEDDRESQKPQSSESKPQKKGANREPVPAAPSTRRLAHEKGVDLHNIEPSGKKGRVTAEDVEAAASTAESQKRSAKQSTSSPRGGSGLIPAQTEPPPLPDLSQWGGIERAPLRSVRRATARNMALSWGQIPHVYHQDIADITELERFRRSHESAGQVQGGKFTLTVLVMKALAATLKQFPRFNSCLDVDNQEIVYKRYFHMGMAVATDRGLLVPVVRDVDRKNLIELSAESADIARKARNGELTREDMQGASMTVTNPGAMGGSSLTPLINHPQVAILGMGQARLEPVVQGDLDNYDIRPRLRLPLVLGFDHRVNDGADAAQFVTRLIRTLANPESLLLSI